MSATIINGRELADALLDDVRTQVDALGVAPHLAALCAGDDPGLRSFVRIKQKAAQSVGVQFSSYLFAAGDEEGMRTTLRYLAADDTVQGIFIELPLPPAWDTDSLCALIPQSKDVDVLAPATRDAYYRDASPVLPPSVVALRCVLEAHGLNVAGMDAVVIGAGELVGKPIAHWLAAHGARVRVADIDTKEPARIVRTADLVVAATGVPGLVTGAWVQDGAVVIDFGYGKKGDAHAGDVDTASVQKKAGLLSPVPGGMGPLVVAAVLENLLTLAVR